MNFQLTMHALDRYIDRIAPGLTRQEAQERLTFALAHAVRLKDKSTQGHLMWKIENPPMRVVTKRDNAMDVVVTVLGPHSEMLPADLTHMQEILREREEFAEHLKQRQVELDRELSAKKLLKDAARKENAAAVAQKQADERALAYEQAKAKASLKSEAQLLQQEQAKASRISATDVEIQRMHEKGKLLALEIQILSLELAPIREREKTIRHVANQEGRLRKVKDSLRLALRSLMGELTPAEAVAAIHNVEGEENLLSPSFYNWTPEKPEEK